MILLLQLDIKIQELKFVCYLRNRKIEKRLDCCLGTCSHFVALLKLQAISFSVFADFQEYDILMFS